ncbi:MAG: hypothetical protein M3R61_00200 [Chloroflexota bacterium]|nr:hypothetical protein [Chloroflexota bacterium]
MAQTTGGVSAVNAVIEWSTNGSAWTLFSSHANKLDASGGQRKTGEIETFDGDTVILTPGKRGSIDIKVAAVYTETVGEVQQIARAAQQAATPFYLRWSVKAATTGTLRYTTSAGYLTDSIFPDVDASSAKPVMCMLTLKTPEVTVAAIP